ncbi:MAG: hydantoinase/oxoprolinase family protein [Actinobacteria bacterium]|nr:hydantoinase/oxoprolinase family protein [Actinomycetota bacterium]
MSYRIGIDVGGTFTDFLVVDDDGATSTYKTLSTPEDPSVGVLDGLGQMAADREIGLEQFVAQVDRVVHGTTVATNAVLTNDGAKVGLLTTEGFRDFLHMRRGAKERPFDNKMPYPKPLVERYLVRGVRERTDYRGEVTTELDAAGLSEELDYLREQGVEALAICFMHSYANAANEEAAAAVTRAALPDAYLSVSSELLPQIRLYDRISTTALNSYVGPIIRNYLDKLIERLRGIGFGGVLLIMKSNGGVTTPEHAQAVAVNTVLSGPASAPVAGAQYAGVHGYQDSLTVDMGGTSFDVAMIKDGEPALVNEGKIGPWNLAIPVVDIVTIGAGGGSIASVDNGILSVGPASAGADPGPACYGFGGDRPTVTDADLVLGYLDPDYFLGGTMQLDKERSEAVISEQIAAPLGISVHEAAAGIYDLINVNMAVGVREVTVRRGYDPRDFPLLCAGGAGPIHAGMIALELEVPVAIVPSESSIFCAAGMLMSDLKHDFVRTYKVELDGADLDRLRAAFAEMVEEGRRTLEEEHVDVDRIRRQQTADLRYLGQNNELSIPLPEEVLASGDLGALVAAFHRRHDELFGYSTPEIGLELVNLRVACVGATEKPGMVEQPYDGEDPGAAFKRERSVYMRNRGWLEVPVYDGHLLRHGNLISGAAIVEQRNTTILVLPEFDLVCDRNGSFVTYLRDHADAGPSRYVAAGATAGSGT